MTFPRMADHYLKTLELLDDVAAVRAAIALEHDKPAEERDRRRLGRLHADYGMLLKIAEVHALLAVRAEVEHVASLVDYGQRQPRLVHL